MSVLSLNEESCGGGKGEEKEGEREQRERKEHGESWRAAQLRALVGVGSVWSRG